MYPYKCFRILTLDLACTLYEQCVFQHNMQYSVQVKSGVQMRNDLYILVRFRFILLSFDSLAIVSNQALLLILFKNGIRNWK